MPQIAYRANLSAAVYPMTIADGGRTVIVPGPDQNFDRRVDPTGEQKDAGIPQALYLEDVIPTVSGYQSVGYRNTGTMPGEFTPTPGTPAVFQTMKFFFGESLNQSVLTVAFRAVASYTDHIASNLQSVPLAWTQGTGTSPDDPKQSGATPAGLSAARVAGTNYLFDGITLYEVTNPSANVVDITDIGGTVTGITLADVVAICSCANYLIALLDDNTIAYSSTTTPTDFVPSLVSGAGSILPADLQSSANFLAEAPNGFYIYSTTGVVYAAYTGNSRYPFKFTAIENSGGYTWGTQVSSNRTKSTQFAIDNSRNIRAISPSGAQIIAPELSTFLERQTRYDLFDYTTNAITFAPYTLPTYPTIVLVLDKYILVQVGSYFITYDTVLQRYGRLKRSGFIASREDTVATQIHFLATSISDQCSVMSFDQYDVNYTHAGVLLLGKFQYVRSRKIQLHEIQIEGPQDTAVVASPNFSCVLLPSIDGRMFGTPVPLTPVAIANGLAIYPAHATAQNHSIAIKGAFNVSTLQLRFSPRGDR
jgi:hypothetical protein